MSKIDFKNLGVQLKSVGLKVTPARMTILYYLQLAGKPQTASQIKKQLGSAQIDLVTVYRNLESLVKTGLAKKVLLNDDEAYYEINLKHHHHLVCVSCGRIEDFELCNIQPLTKEALKKSKFFKAVSEHSLELFGLCKVCAP